MRSNFYEKQQAGVKIVSAFHIPEKGKPHTPEFWNRTVFKLEDGSIYTVKHDDRLKNHGWRWIND